MSSNEHRKGVMSLSPVHVELKNVTIRATAAQDKTPLAAILAATKAFTQEEVDCALELLDIYLANPRQKDYDFFCAVDTHNAPLGYVCYGKAPFTDAVFYLYWIAVHPQAQGAGIGQLLMKHLEELLARQHARMLLIETASKASYGQTRAFYDRSGFSEWSRIKDFYRLHDDRITYGKSFAACAASAVTAGIGEQENTSAR